MNNNDDEHATEPRPWRFLAILCACGLSFVIVTRYLVGSSPTALPEQAPPTVRTSEVVTQGTSFAARGNEVFDRLGCAACHGPEGAGGVENPNYVLGTVPALNEMADRLMLFDPEDAVAAVELLERDADLASLAHSPPFPGYQRFVAQYGAVTSLIENGATAAKKDPTGPVPPLQMLPWGDQLSDEEMRGLMVYLIELYDWEE